MILALTQINDLIATLKVARAKAEALAEQDQGRGDFDWCLMRIAEAEGHVNDALQRIEPAVAAEPVARLVDDICADQMARLRADAASDDGTRVANAHAEHAVLTDYARAKGRI